MYRLYFWFKGTDPNRKGGPWWVKDFKCTSDLEAFKYNQMEFLHAWAIETGDHLIKLSAYPYDNWTNENFHVVPPQNIEIHYSR